MINPPRIMITSISSDSGKTWLTCGLLELLKRKNIKAASFKCGPDYIDPLFHSIIFSKKSKNLDTFLIEKQTIKKLFFDTASKADISIIEGVMGYYDGLGGISTDASAYDIAQTLKIPTILVIKCKGMSTTIPAIIKGILSFRKNNQIKGVILNYISETQYKKIKLLIENELCIKVIGYIPFQKELVIKHRHLGLITPNEIANIQNIFSKIADLLEKTIDLDLLLETARNTTPIFSSIAETKALIITPKKETVRPVIAVARDKAFCFYYQDNLELLEKLGADIKIFSPISDIYLPENTSGLYLGGGYPELYAKELSKNTTLLNNIKTALNHNLPCIAECGGFMYLLEKLQGIDKNFYSMVGFLKGTAFQTTKLSHFGYLNLIVQKDNILCKKGTVLSAHEFHYWNSDNNGDSAIAKKPLQPENWNCIHTNHQIWAGYPHIHFYSNQVLGINFINACRNYFKTTKQRVN